MEPITVNILGTEYTITEVPCDEDINLENADGYCDPTMKKIVLSDLKEYTKSSDERRKVMQKVTIRHEIIHAFLGESGLERCSNPSKGGWSKNEEMVDWIALQFPKILEVYKQLDCL